MKMLQKTQTSKTFAIPNFLPKILPDDEIVEVMNLLNSKQKEILIAVHILAKDYVKYDGHNVEPVHIFLSGSGSIGKSHLVKVISKILKTLLYHCKGPKNRELVYLDLQEYQL